MEYVDRPTRIWIILAVAIAAVLTMSDTLSSTRGRCATVEVPWPIVLPDGSVHDSGSLKVCMHHQMNPITGLHEVRVDGMTIGLFASRTGASEGRSGAHPVMVFHRGEHGRHHLVGYAWPTVEGMETHLLYHFGKTIERPLPPRLPLSAQNDDGKPGYVELSARMTR
jgi:hypothetical protein